jgi:acetyltransferase-like isoleucine patch superfamily enzyme
VVIGSDVKVQNYVSIYHGVVIEDGVMVGPHVCFTNDRLPRAIRPDGARKGADDWQVSETRIAYGAGLGANSTIVCGVVVGRWALVGAGSVVTRNVPPYGLVFGNPARLRGFVSPAGVRAQLQHVGDEQVVFVCPESQEPFTIPRTDYALLEQDTR